MNNPPHQHHHHRHQDEPSHHQIEAGQAGLVANIELPHVRTPSRNSFDSLDAVPEIGQRSPGKVIAFIQ